MTEKKKGMSIKKKLLLSYFSIVVLILVIGIIGIYNVKEVYDNGNEIYVNNLKSVDYLKSINQNVKEIDQCVISMMSILDEENHDSYITKITRLQEENRMLMEQYEGLQITALEERRYNQCRLSILTFDKQIENIVENLNQGNVEAAVGAYKQELMPVKACTYELVEAVVELSTATAQSKNEENQSIHQNLIWMIGLIMVVSIIVAVIITIRMSRYFTDKLVAIQRLAKRLSEYNIADDIQNVENDEFGQTMVALNDSQFMMRTLLEEIIDESATISETGEEVSMAVRKSAQRIETVNMKVLQSGEMAQQMDETVHQILDKHSVDEETASALSSFLKKSDEAKNKLSDARSELNSVVTYLEQIGVTSDYQNELANNHKERVQKFKV